MLKFTIQFPDGSKKDFRSDKSKIILGKSQQCDVVIDSEGLSRKHVEINFREKQIFVTDLQSTNGVYINDQRIEAGVEVLFQSFFPLKIGKNILVTITPETSEDIEVNLQQEIRREHGPHESKKIESKNSKHRERKKEFTESNKDQSTAQTKVIGLVFFLFLVSVTYYNYQQNGQDNSPSQETISQSKPQAHVVSKTSPAPSKIEDMPYYETQFTASKCSSEIEKEICQIVFESHQIQSHEGIVLAEKKAILYLELTSWKNGIESDPRSILFKALDEAKKDKLIIMLHNSNPLIWVKLREKKITTFDVVGFYSSEGSGKFLVSSMNLEQEIIFPYGEFLNLKDGVYFDRNVSKFNERVSSFLSVKELP